MTKQSFLILCGTLALMVPATIPAYAEEPKLIYGDAASGGWTAWAAIENGKKICYIASQPEKDEGKYSSRGEIYALVTTRQADGSKNVFSYIAGYPYKPTSDVTVKIDSQSFTLFTQDDTAWAPDAATDEKIAQAMSKGSTMVVKGTSSRGTPTVDTFSLKGSATARQAMAKECNSKE